MTTFAVLATTPEELEIVRKTQEIAWYRAGYTRQQIATFLRGWPEIFGHGTYEWTIGDPPADMRG